jgi:hypothetical protein
MTFPQVVTPERFNRGSTLLTTTLSCLSKGRGASPDSPGFPPFEILRAVSPVERLKACGNDGTDKAINRDYAASCGQLIREIR